MELKAQKPIDRRALVRGAAWSAPVVVFAVAAPQASASPGWNVSVTAGCLIGIAGVDALPGFRIAETANRLPPASLSFAQRIVYSGSFYYGGTAILGYNPARAAAVLVARAALGLYFVAGITEVPSANLTRGGWSSPVAAAPYVELAQVGASGGQTLVTFTISRTRTLTVANLPRLGSAGLGYALSAGIALPGSEINNVVTANAGSGGALSSDDSATLTAALLSVSC